MTTQPPKSVELKGNFLESRKKLADSLKLILKNPGKKWEAAVKRRLKKLKYSIITWDLSNGVLKLKVIPQKVIRHVFIRGNWPLFETDIMRRIILRPGTPLPPLGNSRNELFETQISRIKDYLHREGYFDSQIKVVLKSKKSSYKIDLVIQLDKGSSYKLGKLTIKGNKNLSSKIIEKFFRHKVLFYEKPFYNRIFRKDMKRLKKHYGKLGYFAVSVRSNFDELYSLDKKKRVVNITIFIRERRKVTISFEGRKKTGLRDLKKQLTFIESGNYDEHEIKRSAANIQHHYQTKGHFNATVFPESHVLGATGLKIIFHIQEGKQHRVGKIKFRGNKFLSNSSLNSDITTKVFPKKLAVFGLGSGGFITPKQLSQDVERIKKAYNAKGFQDTEVAVSVIYPKLGRYIAGPASINAAVPTSSGNSYVSVIFTIKEGKRVLFSNIKFVGIPKDIISKLKRISKIKSGAPFSKEGISKDLKKYARFMANKGYPYHSITTEISTIKNGKGVAVLYTFKMNQKVKFGAVFIRGNFKTRDSVLWREIPFRAGDKFSLSKIEQAGRNLRSLGVFRSVRIIFLGLETKQKTVPVIVSVIERYDDAGEMEIGGGFSTDNLYFTSLSYKNRNIFGLAKSIEFKGEVGAEILSGTVTYQDSRFLGTKLFFQTMAYGRSEKTVRLGDIITYGSSITLKKRWSQRFQWFLRYEIRHVSYKETLYRVSSGMGEDSKVNFATTTASLGPAMVWDKRDNPLVPTKGYRLSSSVRFASRYLGGDDHFLHFNLSGQFFIPLPLGIIIAHGIRYDHGTPLFSTNALPKVERFYSGGDTTVRGYEEDRLFSQVVKTPLAPVGNTFIYKLSPLGGNIRFISNTELQFPIWKKSPLLGMPIRGAVFFDTGYIINSYSGFGSSLVHSGWGGAVRLVTPVGVVSFEYALPLNNVLGTDPNGRFHFNFGFIF